MRINFCPVRMDEKLSLSVARDIVTINGEDFDFTALPEGAELPREAIDSDWFCGNVSRQAGELHLVLRLPHGPIPSLAQAFPAPLRVLADGPVELPQ